MSAARRRPRRAGRGASLIAAASLVLSAGCAAPPENPHAPSDESAALGTAVQLTRGFGRAGEAYFSPDMRWIVFQATPPGEPHYQMYVAGLQRDAEGRIVGAAEPTRVSPAASRNTCGWFSPDGDTLIFASTAGRDDPSAPVAGYQRQGRDYRWSYPTGMEIYRADGWQAAVEAAGPGGAVDLARHAVTSNDAYDAECAIAPDGGWIVFCSNRDGDLELYASRLDGRDVVRLTRAAGYDGGPFFSPDGARLVYRSDRAGNDLLQVFSAEIVRDDDGRIVGLRDERRLTVDAHVNWGPYWHPGGRHIVYATSRHGHANYELYLMRADGSRKTRLTMRDGADVLPVVSPDGRWLLWSSRRSDDGTTQVFAAPFRLPRGS